MTKKYRSLENIIRDVYEGKGDPCWDGYKQEGMKKKNGKNVPNCVPVNEEVEQIDEVIFTIEEIMEALIEELQLVEQAAPAITIPSGGPAITGGGVTVDPSVSRGIPANVNLRQAARQAIERLGPRMAARRAATAATGIGLHPLIQGGLAVTDAIALAREIRRITGNSAELTGAERRAAEDIWRRSNEFAGVGETPPGRIDLPDAPPSEVPTAAPEQPVAPSAEPTPTITPTPMSAPATRTAPEALPEPNTDTIAQTRTQTQTRTQERTGRGRGRPRIGLGFPGLSSSSSVTPSDVRQAHVATYQHYATPALRVNEDATAERSKIENVARPSARRDRVVKQQEIQRKIIDENRSLAATVKKNVEETRKRERNSSPIIVNPKTNDPDPDGTPGGY